MLWLDIPPEPIKGVLVDVLLKRPPQDKSEVGSFGEPPLGADSKVRMCESTIGTGLDRQRSNCDVGQPGNIG